MKTVKRHWGSLDTLERPVRLIDLVLDNNAGGGMARPGFGYWVLGEVKRDIFVYLSVALATTAQRFRKEPINEVTFHDTDLHIANATKVCNKGSFVLGHNLLHCFCSSQW